MKTSLLELHPKLKFLSVLILALIGFPSLVAQDLQRQNYGASR